MENKERIAKAPIVFIQGGITGTPEQLAQRDADHEYYLKELGYRLIPELTPLSDEEIKEIFLEHYTQQYGEEAAKELLEKLPDCNYAKAVAQTQLNHTKEQLANQGGENE